MSVAEPVAVELPKVLGESAYDRVSSMLMAVVAGAAIIVGWLALVYITNQAYKMRVSAPVEIVEVFGGGGGSPEGEVGATEKVDVPGAEAAAQASNNEEMASAFEEPTVQLTPNTTLDAVSEPGKEAAEQADFGAAMPTGGAIATGKRASKLGTGGPAFGFGPGDGGVSREQRWTIAYPVGQTADDYARQLDALGVELATAQGNTLVYGSRFSGTPARRIGSPADDKRLYFLWRGQGRKQSDVALLARAGIDVGEGAIFQFYPPAVEETLQRLENAYRGRQPAEIRLTRFGVVPRNNGYGFEVMDQQTLR